MASLSLSGDVIGGAECIGLSGCTILWREASKFSVVAEIIIQFLLVTEVYGALGICPSMIGPLDLLNLGLRPGNDGKRVRS